MTVCTLMLQVMAIGAEHDEVLLAISSRLASVHDVMNLELISATTTLAPPPISLKNLKAEPCIILMAQVKASAFRGAPAHADRRNVSRNNCCCAGERARK